MLMLVSQPVDIFVITRFSSPHAFLVFCSLMPSGCVTVNGRGQLSRIYW